MGKIEFHPLEDIEKILGPIVGSSIRLKHQKELENVICKVKKTGEMQSIKAQDGAEIYGYPSGGSVNWGVNGPKSGFNLVRGVRRPDGADEVTISRPGGEPAKVQFSIGKTKYKMLDISERDGLGKARPEGKFWAILENLSALEQAPRRGRR